MEDGELAKYISSFGDRLALMNFCKNQTQLRKQKMGLFEKLRAKLQSRKEVGANEIKDKEPNIQSTIPSRKRGRASHHKIEIG